MYSPDNLSRHNVERESEFPRRVALILVVVLFTAALWGTEWYFRYVRGQKTQHAPTRPPQRAAVVAVLAPAAPAQASPETQTSRRPEQTGKTTEREIPIHPLEQFRQETKAQLAQELVQSYPQIPDLNRDPAKLDPAYRDSVFQFLEAAEKASDAQRPAMLLAADFMLQAVWCPSEKQAECDDLRSQFAGHHLTFANSPLAGAWYYQHDLLWRDWQEFPTTQCGERAFVLLLDSGWDTSGTCAKGADQFREVIRQGESFLQQRENSPYRDYVVHLLGQAYATWWSLAQPPTSSSSDYVDPKQYQEGAEDARLKAIQYFEQNLQSSPASPVGEYANQILPVLREKKLLVDSYRFFCVYD